MLSAALGCTAVPREPPHVATPPAASGPIDEVRFAPEPATDTEHEIEPASFEFPSEDAPRPGPNDGLTFDEPLSSVPVPLRPRTIDEVLYPAATLQAPASGPPVLPLNLTAALQMAGGQSPQIAFAAARYREAYARYEGAQTLWLPSIRAGLSYHHHDGNLQASGGEILDLSRSSLQSGLGVGAVGAGTTPVPGIVAQFHTSDAVFQPDITAHAASAERAGMQTATNDTLLEAALAYLGLLEAFGELQIAEETLENARQLSELTSTFARTGQGSQADADRALTHLTRRKNDVSRAEEGTRVAAARLAEVLSTDPTTAIVPEEETIVPIDLVPLDLAANELVATGLSNRPELSEAQYLVCEAVYRYRREKYAPLLPSVLLGVSQTSFGGGLGSGLDEFRSRFDYDALAYWELRNFGWGEVAHRDETRASYDRARAAQARLMDRVAREVVEAQAQVAARRQQIATAESGIDAARNAYDRDMARIREAAGLPIEALQSVQALDEARREYVRAVVDYNEAQFRLQWALGWPIR